MTESPEPALSAARPYRDALLRHWEGKDRVVMLSDEWGDGRHFLETWQIWRASGDSAPSLHYLVCNAPLLSADEFLDRMPPDLRGSELAAQFHAVWPTATPGFHRLELEHGRILLTLAFANPHKVLLQSQQDLWQIHARVDWFAFEAASLDKAHIKRLARMANPGAILELFQPCANSIEDIAREGFCSTEQGVEASPSEPFLTRFTPKPWQTSGSPAPKSRHAAIIGAGLAGAACAERLAARGWSITLIDQNSGPAQAASGNLAGIAMPLIARDDSIASRLSRAAYLYALRTWKRLDKSPQEQFWEQSGVMQLARDAEHEAVQRKLVAELGYPAEFVDFLEQAQAEAQIGHPLPCGGWMFSQGGYVSPPGLCRSLLNQAARHAQRAQGDLKYLFGKRVFSLQHGDQGWHILGDDNEILAKAGTVILASGADAEGLAQARALPLERTRGQVSLLPEGSLGEVHAALCREGYVTPALNGAHCVGASYDLADEPALRAADHAGNLDRLERLLPGRREHIEQQWHPATLEGRVGFRAVAPDRLPLVGPLADYDLAPHSKATQLDALPRYQGLYAALGYASRGLVWSNLMAELLASIIEEDPLPVEFSLAQAVDPGRFLLKALRRHTA